MVSPTLRTNYFSKHDPPPGEIILANFRTVSLSLYLSYGHKLELSLSYSHQQFQIGLMPSHQDGDSKVGDVIMPLGLWTTIGLLSSRCSW